MKRTILFISILLLTASLTQAQNRNRQRIKLLKMSYITDALDLTEKEAEKFWPVYNEFTAKMQQLRQEQQSGIKREIGQSNGLNNISEEKARTILDRSMKLESEIAAAKIAMNNELLGIISAVKILKLHQAERDFNREMLQEFGKRRGLKRQ